MSENIVLLGGGEFECKADTREVGRNLEGRRASSDVAGSVCLRTLLGIFVTGLEMRCRGMTIGQGVMVFAYDVRYGDGGQSAVRP